MAVRPRRKSPISTRPIYLPKVPARDLPAAAPAEPPVEAGGLCVYVDGDTGLDLEGLAGRLSGLAGRPAALGGDLVSALAGRPHTQVRDAVAAAAHRLAWARIGRPDREDYRILPPRGEVDREEARLRARSQPEYEGLAKPTPPPDALYDGVAVQSAYRELLPGEGTVVVVTDRRLGRWDAHDGRWAPAPVIAGNPVVVSVAPGTEPADALATGFRRALTQ